MSPPFHVRCAKTSSTNASATGKNGGGYEASRNLCDRWSFLIFLFDSVTFIQFGKYWEKTKKQKNLIEKKIVTKKLKKMARLATKNKWGAPWNGLSLFEFLLHIFTPSMSAPFLSPYFSTSFLVDIYFSSCCIYSILLLNCQSPYYIL